MKITLMTGSHPRHLYVANQLRKANLLGGLVIEKRGDFVPSPPANLADIDRENFIRHFKDRDEAEHRFFDREESYKLETVPTLHTTKDKLNSTETIQWVRDNHPDIVITYGVHKLSNEMLASLPDKAWNIHGGLSPWYRGNITLFWPFYFLQPNWAGMTIHELTSKLDAGAIIHHSVPELSYGDGIHDVACKAVQSVTKDIVAILERLKQGYIPTSVLQKSSGKLFLGVDWKPQQLRLIYQTFNNDIVDQYLDGKLGHSEPDLVNALKNEPRG